MLTVNKSVYELINEELPTKNKKKHKKRKDKNKKIKTEV
jgi:hypothetical protein